MQIAQSAIPRAARAPSTACAVARREPRADTAASAVVVFAVTNVDYIILLSVLFARRDLRFHSSPRQLGVGVGPANDPDGNRRRQCSVSRRQSDPHDERIPDTGAWRRASRAPDPGS